MAIKKTLLSIILVGTLIFGLNSCKLKFEKIGYKVSYTKDDGTKDIFEDFNKDSLFENLIVKKPNGTEIKYARSLLDDKLVKKLNGIYKTILDFK